MYIFKYLITASERLVSKKGWPNTKARTHTHTRNYHLYTTSTSSQSQSTLDVLESHFSSNYSLVDTRIASPYVRVINLAKKYAHVYRYYLDIDIGA